MLYKHRYTGTQTVKIGFTQLQQAGTSWVDVHVLHRQTHTSHAQLTLYASRCNASWLYGWMDAWFETCLWSPPRQGMGIDGFMFRDMLYWHTALLSHPGSSLVYTANFNPIYPKLTALYNSAFSFDTSSLSLLIPLFPSLFVCCLHSSLTFSSSFLCTP